MMRLFPGAQGNGREPRAPGSRWCILATGVSLVLVLVVYVWVVSAGKMIQWPPALNMGYYVALLADAFLHRQTSLRVMPDPRLLALPDPYDPLTNAPFRLHDALLFNGRYYLYWGPVPSLILAGLYITTGLSALADRYLSLRFHRRHSTFLHVIALAPSQSIFRRTPLMGLRSGRDDGRALSSRPLHAGQACDLRSVDHGRAMLSDGRTSVGLPGFIGTAPRLVVVSAGGLFLGVGGRL